MRITIVITNPDLAGAQNHVLTLIEGLRAKHEFTCISMSFNEHSSKSIDFHANQWISMEVNEFL